MPPKIQKWLFFFRFVNAYLTNGQNTFAWSSFAPQWFTLSDLQFTHWWFMCIFWNCCLFFLSRIFFPTHTSNKNGQKKWKILIYYIFFQGCLPKLHHIIVKSYNKCKIQFLPFLHLIEKLFLCISLPLFCNTWYSTKVCKYVATTYF